MKFIKLKEQSKITPRLTTDCDKWMDEPLIKMQWERAKWILVLINEDNLCFRFVDFQRIVIEPIR